MLPVVGSSDCLVLNPNTICKKPDNTWKLGATTAAVESSQSFCQRRETFSLLQLVGTTAQCNETALLLKFLASKNNQIAVTLHLLTVVSDHTISASVPTPRSVKR